MKNYIKHHEWCIIENGFIPHFNKISESIFSIGNGRMGQRANFEEKYTGDTLQGSYLAGVYYPDKTRVGWWKNGYPEYFAKVLNSVNWIGIDVEIDGVTVDVAQCDVTQFKRTLNMQEGYLQREMTFTFNKKSFTILSTRFCSIHDDEIGAIKYQIIAHESATISLKPYLDGDVRNQDANYGDKFWVPLHHEADSQLAAISAETKKTGFQVAAAMQCHCEFNGILLDTDVIQSKEDFASFSYKQELKANEKLVLYKYVGITSTLNHASGALIENAKKEAQKGFQKGFDKLLLEQKNAWLNKWKDSDIIIEGDIAAQQAIRFNIFQLNQTYTGEDERLNIGPKGFTGEKYGGSTYWDTEAYCIPFYLATAEEKVSRNLLRYRYKQLPQAIENAQKIRFCLWCSFVSNGDHERRRMP